MEFVWYVAAHCWRLCNTSSMLFGLQLMGVGKVEEVWKEVVVREGDESFILVYSGCTLLEVVQYQQHAVGVRSKPLVHPTPRKI